MTLVEEVMQATLSAADDRKQAALRILRGESEPARSGAQSNGPLLMGMGAASGLLGVSRATLWRACQAGRIEKVELFPGSYRVRRADLEALAAGKFGLSEHVSRRGRPSKVRGQKSGIRGQGARACAVGCRRTEQGDKEYPRSEEG